MQNFKFESSDQWVRTFDIEPRLDLLVANANVGLRALAQLSKYKKEIQFDLSNFDNGFIDCDDSSGFFDSLLKNTNLRFRLKPKSKFESFTTNNGWKVEIKGGRLHIGCKDFDPKQVKLMLTELIVENKDGGRVGDIDCDATKKGIRYNEVVSGAEHILLWVDGEEILARLEKAGVR